MRLCHVDFFQQARAVARARKRFRARAGNDQLGQSGHVRFRQIANLGNAGRVVERGQPHGERLHCGFGIRSALFQRTQQPVGAQVRKPRDARFLSIAYRRSIDRLVERCVPGPARPYRRRWRFEMLPQRACNRCAAGKRSDRHHRNKAAHLSSAIVPAHSGEPRRASGLRRDWTRKSIARRQRATATTHTKRAPRRQVPPRMPKALRA